MPYDHPTAVLLTAEVQVEYAHRYGDEGDTAPLAAAELVPPAGLFLLATLDGTPAGMGGWRRGGPDGDADAEIKRMYVRADARGRGVARRLLAELERTAGAAGVTRMVLETGEAQPEALALYRSSGYTAVPAFGYYAEAELSVHLGKRLPAEGSDADAAGGAASPPPRHRTAPSPPGPRA